MRHMLLKRQREVPPSRITLPDPVTTSFVSVAVVCRRRVEFARACACICSIRRGRGGGSGVDGSADEEESPQLALQKEP